MKEGFFTVNQKVPALALPDTKVATSGPFAIFWDRSKKFNAVLTVYSSYSRRGDKSADFEILKSILRLALQKERSISVIVIPFSYKIHNYHHFSVSHESEVDAIIYMLENKLDYIGGEIHP